MGPMDNHPVVGFALYSKLQSQTLVGRWSSGKKGHRSDARVRAVLKKISNVSISRRTQMDCTNAEGVSRETAPFTFQTMLCSAEGWYCAPTFRLYEGVSLTMAKIREKYWIPRLRWLTERVINECLGCKRFQVTALANPPTGNLPKERREGSVPFKSIGVDFAGPIKYLSKSKREMKPCILLYAYSSTRAVYLDLLPV